MTGRSALRRACRKITTRAGSPLALAVRMKSCRKTSSMDDRMKRDMPATLPTVMTVMGKTRCLPRSISFPQKDSDS